MKNFLKRFWTLIFETFRHPTVVSVIDEEGNVIERDGKLMKEPHFVSELLNLIAWSFLIVIAVVLAVIYINDYTIIIVPNEPPAIEDTIGN